jgi:hypothetical protein
MATMLNPYETGNINFILLPLVRHIHVSSLNDAVCRSDYMLIAPSNEVFNE